MKILNREQRLDLFRKLAASPKFEKLPKRLQDALTYMAAGYTDEELSKMYKISHGTPWSYRESIFKKYGLRVYNAKKWDTHTQGFSRAMTMVEIYEKLFFAPRNKIGLLNLRNVEQKGNN